ncbi:hypothetical protein NPIL_425891 [Nephila pilipes]|uniref:Uncharacterized protein n=1 Tax=Nephila pilipes TaxID=299642 RepID=A0A8X6MY44_NEPPI|nr:hypothetical protein NPIL_425891 [Nephila pilipes]
MSSTTMRNRKPLFHRRNLVTSERTAGVELNSVRGKVKSRVRSRVATVLIIQKNILTLKATPPLKLLNQRENSSENALPAIKREHGNDFQLSVIVVQ